MFHLHHHHMEPIVRVSTGMILGMVLALVLMLAVAVV